MKYLIIGLGNVGGKYEKTRHNIGFMVVDTIAEQAKAAWQIDRHAYIAKVKFKGRTLILVKPTTLMNLSGKAVKYWMDKEKVPVEKTLIITDDIDLEMGKLRLRPKGSGGSHNGMTHIIETLGTNEFPRLRFGIGSDFAKGYQVEYVLSRFSKSEIKEIEPRIDLAIEIVKSFVTVGINQTMNEYNSR
ncbi:MAG: aminoacyl-tRNA hydrolase [Bacteroidales bacterium]|nr:aminoacyl-tRNA hydrolase [Bacteroidales bacterium]